MRTSRIAALGATTLALALVLGACSSGGGSTPAPSTGGSVPTVASQLVLGGPPECPDRPFCLKGLQDVYGLQFKDFKALDAGGPLTVEALKNGDIGVGLLFTSDPAIASNGFVLLQDDKTLQLADNLVPVVRQELVDAHPDVATLLNGIMAKLSQEALTGLNKQVTVDGQASADVAKAWLTDNGFLPGAGGASMGTIKVGSTNFYEQEILGELFSQVLEANGFTVERKFQLGNREIVFPALEKGEIDVLAEYAATALEYVNGGAGQASTDVTATVEALRTALADKGLTALDPAAATDQNGFVVTQDTASTYGLVKISDLGKPAP
jgi:osmoprotectant transport system substrate-binding protein